MKYLKSQDTIDKRTKLEKILLSSVPSIEFEKLHKDGTLETFLPELYNTIGIEQNKYHRWDVYGHIMKTVDNSKPKLLIRYSALLHDIGKPYTKSIDDGEVHFYKHEIKSAEIADKLLNELGYDKSFVEDVKQLVLGHMELKYAKDDGGVTNAALKRFRERHKSYLDDLLDLMQADNISHGTSHDMFKQIEKIKFKLQS